MIGGRARGSQTSLREANSASVVEAVKLYGQITQVELAAVTGLSPATISNLVKQLQADGVVQTDATIRSGRRAQLVSLKRTSGLSVGVHIGRRQASVVVSDASWRINLSQHLPLPADHRSDTTLDRVALLVAELSEQVGADLDEVEAIGVAAPVSDGRPGPPGLAGWEDIDVAAVLERRLGRRVLMVGEAEAVAVAETRFGSLRGVGSALVVRSSAVTDSCLVVNGRPLAGRAGALGHIQVDPAGRICRCGGRGCLNTVVSSLSLQELLRVSHGPMSLKAIVEAAKRGDAGCYQVIADAGAAVGSVVADAAVLLAPERICVAGDLAAAGGVFIEPIRQALRSRPVLENGPELVVMADCEEPEARGAWASAQDVAETTRTVAE
ncbi:ROK family transcriptional regulator [Tessaracoccus caeni]|uniref:ROK family transcriptional regulator n=1 Tax=Tessaracoccus caeni TaxID=3031239 RepID=UPI0023DBD79F|nr:ROK family transcriptional regulator [Tessaracoccus caeni]MDF1487556.1 ROK family transcriptional regulator [Tessaracoccus caeni]